MKILAKIKETGNQLHGSGAEQRGEIKQLGGN